ncbi:MAG: DMT family transporter [Paracoccus sp. (in: a-proteobacteria)]|nr:DMT family transporter [Paracoccus sp. (in: a-proteobacteria)]
MIVAMAAFALEDSLVKAATRDLPVGQVLMMFGLGGAAIFAALARVNGIHILTRDAVSPVMCLRMVFETSGRLFYVLALAFIPLSAATVILQATPIVVVAAAALLLKEPVGPRRWAAIIIGMCGVLAILRPTSDSFSMLSILAVLGMLGFAGRDLTSRIAPASLGTPVLGFYGFVAVTLAGLLFSLWSGAVFRMPGPDAGLCVAGAIVGGVLAYSCLMKAMRTGDVAAVTPFRYVRLIFGISLGVVLFGEQVSTGTLAGSALIVLSGLLTIRPVAR